MFRVCIVFVVSWISVNSTVKTQDAGIYMAINALAGVDEFGNIFKRRIEVDWHGAEV